MAYTRGNLAVKQKEEQQRSSQQRYRETTKVVTRRRELPIREKLLYLTTIVVCVVVAGFLIGRYAQLYQLNTSIHRADVAISTLNTSIAELQIEKEKLENQVLPKAKELGYIEPTQLPIRVKQNVTPGVSTESNSK